MRVIKSVNDEKGYIKLYKKVKSSVRNLKTWMWIQVFIGNLLVPLIKAKLANELGLIISRKIEIEVWLLSVLLKVH